MKVVVLAGGFGTRISEESHLKPKPMIEIGDRPILWHIMKHYSTYGHNEFIICAGYKQNIIKEYFAQYYLHNSDVTFDFSDKNNIIIHSNVAEPWKVTVVDTGLKTMTGGRIKRIKSYVGDEDFLLKYGDGLSDVNIEELVKFHKSNGKIATLTAIHIGQRFGILEIGKSGNISAFREKSADDSSVVNGGFMALSPKIFDYIEDDTTVFEKEPLEKLSKDGELMAYIHSGFWQCMDTQRDKEMLEKLWASGNAPWKRW